MNEFTHSFFFTIIKHTGGGIDMAKKYVATIMNRLFLGDDNFIFVPSHTVLGEYDEELSIFTDRNGSEYISITDPYALQSEVSVGFANLQEMDQLPEIVGKSEMKDAIAEYNYYNSRFILYVSTTMEGDTFCIPIDYMKIKEDLDKAIEEQREQEELAKSGKKAAQDSQEDPDLEENPILSKDLNANIAAFFMDLMDGVYSLSELKEFRERVMSQREDIDALLESIDLQIESSEYGESSIQLKGETATTKKKKRPVTSPTGQVMDSYLDIEGLFQKITKTLIAQDEPTRRVLVEIARKEQSDLNNDRGLLITGATGSGKTKMMELIARYLDRPFLKIDSTQLTVPGYVGKDIEEELWRLYIQCGRDLKKAERAIVFFDEIDKKGSSRKDDISGKGVLNVLLPFFDGATYDACENMKSQREIVQINTRNMLVILGGAFEDVYGDVRGKVDIGFSVDRKPVSTMGNVTVQDFVDKAKMPSEFMGRVAIIKLNDLDLNAIKRILLESDESALRVQEKLFRELGVRLTPSEEFINAIAEQAIQRKTGARGLNTVVDEATWVAYGDAYTHMGEYEEIILGKETVEDPKQYSKIMKKRSD